LVYGGGAVGSMGALADGALSAGGEVIGIIPRFMVELEWAHANLSALELVEDMRRESEGLAALYEGKGSRTAVRPAEPDSPATPGKRKKSARPARS